jgi:uncharacterized protein (DUF1778 family)
VRKPTTHLRLRIEPGLLQRLEKAAESNRRTLTGEIIERLKASFQKSDQEMFVVASAENAANMVIDRLKLRELASLVAELRKDRKSKS